MSETRSELDLLSLGTASSMGRGCGFGCVGALLLACVVLFGEFMPLLEVPQWGWWIERCVLIVGAVLLAIGWGLSSREERQVNRARSACLQELENRLAGREPALLYRSSALPHGGRWLAILSQEGEDMVLQARAAGGADTRAVLTDEQRAVVQQCLAQKPRTNPYATPVMDGLPTWLTIRDSGEAPVTIGVNLAGLADADHPGAQLIQFMQAESQRLTQTGAAWGSTDPYGNIQLHDG